MPGTHASPEVRFWRHVHRSDGCWEWTASTFSGGYGQFKVHAGESSDKAHRYSWVLHFGDIPDGMLVCHHCDNRKCVRPDHLFLGTHLSNARDMIRKGRAVYTRGSAMRSRAKLTELQVCEIRAAYANGDGSMRDLGRRYGVHSSTIVRLVNRKYWVDV